jgi:hypothetical protein
MLRAHTQNNQSKFSYLLLLYSLIHLIICLIKVICVHALFKN